MKIKKPICPACNQQISSLDVQPKFSCPKCQAPLKSTGQNRILAFEIGAFLVLAPLLALAFSSTRYVIAGVVFAVWIGCEYVVRNGVIELSRDAETQVDDAQSQTEGS